MQIVGCNWALIWAWGNHTETMEINMVPAHVFPQISLSEKSCEGQAHAGIKRVRRRLPSGADKTIDFGKFPWDWPPIFPDYMSSITFAVRTSGDASATAGVRMDWWE